MSESKTITIVYFEKNSSMPRKTFYVKNRPTQYLNSAMWSLPGDHRLEIAREQYLAEIEYLNFYYEISNLF